MRFLIFNPFRVLSVISVAFSKHIYRISPANLPHLHLISSSTPPQLHFIATATKRQMHDIYFSTYNNISQFISTFPNKCQHIPKYINLYQSGSTYIPLPKQHTANPDHITSAIQSNFIITAHSHRQGIKAFGIHGHQAAIGE